MVKDVMSGDVLTTHPEAPLAHAARLMFERRVGSLPVILDGRLVDMLTERDVTRALANGRSAESSTPRGHSGRAGDRQQCVPRVGLLYQRVDALKATTGCGARSSM